MRLHDPLEDRKKKRKRWWTPLFGLTMAVVLAIVALMVVPLLRSVWWDLAPTLRSANRLVVQLSTDMWWGLVDVGFAFVIWLVLFGISIAVVLMSIGVDPAEQQAKKLARASFEKKVAERKKKHHRR